MAKSAFWSPKLVFCIQKNSCMINRIMNEAVRDNGSIMDDGDDGNFIIVSGYPRTPPIAIRILRVTRTDDGYIEEWLRISGEPRVVESFLARLRRIKSFEARTTIAYKHRFSVVVSITHRPWEECEDCPVLRVPRGVMPKTVLLSPGTRLLEAIVVERNAMEKLVDKGYTVIRQGDIDEMDYMLTPKQELVLMLAYARGYYDFPRKVKLGDLAKELNLSISTLAELLHKAEKKTVDAFIRHELPHYLAFRILDTKRPIVEKNMRSIIEVISNPGRR